MQKEWHSYQIIIKPINYNAIDLRVATTFSERNRLSGIQR